MNVAHLYIYVRIALNNFRDPAYETFSHMVISLMYEKCVG